MYTVTVIRHYADGSAVRATVTRTALTHALAYARARFAEPSYWGGIRTPLSAVIGHTDRTLRPLSAKEAETTDPDLFGPFPL